MRSSTILILTVFAFIVSENCVRGQTRVIGGKPAALGMFPYQAYLEIIVAENIISRETNNSESYFGSCGGSLISENFVITAAHCLKHKKPLYFEEDGSLHQSTNETILAKAVSVYLGVVDLKNLTNSSEIFEGLNASSFIVHSRFHFKNDTNDPIDAYYDIALIRLPRAVKIHDHVRPVQLPAPGFNAITKEGNAFIVGFGGFNEPSNPNHINDDIRLLRYVNVETLSNLECGIDEPTQLCTRGRRNNINVGTCFGDSGGPLVVRSNGIDTLVGIASYFTGDSCIQGNPNSHFTRVTSYLEWIRENTNM